MRKLTEDERSYTTAIIKEEILKKRIFSILILSMTALSVYGRLPGILIFEWIFYASFVIFAVIFLIASFTAKTNCKISTISGDYKEVVRHSRGRGRSIRHYIGETRVNIPSAWLGEFRQGDSRTAEIYSRGSSFLNFTPIVLSVSGITEASAAISLTEMKIEEKKLISDVKKTFLFFTLAIGLPFLIIVLFFKFITESDIAADFFNANSDSIQKFVDYAFAHDNVLKLIEYVFKYGFIAVVIIVVLIVTLVRAGKTRRVSKSENNAVSGKSWNSWLIEYTDFMKTDFNSFMTRSAANDNSVIMDYSSTINLHKQFQREYKQYIKTLENPDKSIFIQEVKAVNRLIGR